MMSLTRLCVSLLRTVYQPDGYNMGMNLGKTTGAGITDRLGTCTSCLAGTEIPTFMPVVADTKVLPDSLDNTYRKLVEALPAFQPPACGTATAGGAAAMPDDASSSSESRRH